MIMPNPTCPLSAKRWRFSSSPARDAPHANRLKGSEHQKDVSTAPGLPLLAATCPSGSEWLVGSSPTYAYRFSVRGSCKLAYGIATGTGDQSGLSQRPCVEE